MHFWHLSVADLLEEGLLVDLDELLEVGLSDGLRLLGVLLIVIFEKEVEFLRKHFLALQPHFVYVKQGSRGFFGMRSMQDLVLLI